MELFNYIIHTAEIVFVSGTVFFTLRAGIPDAIIKIKYVFK